MAPTTPATCPTICITAVGSLDFSDMVSMTRKNAGATKFNNTAPTMTSRQFFCRIDPTILTIASTHWNAFGRGAAREWRAEAEFRLGARTVAVVQRGQHQIGNGVEVRRIGHGKLDAEIALRIVGGESKTAERCDGFG